MEKYMRLLTRWLPRQIDGLLEAIRGGTRHPRDVKMEMAREITTIFYGEKDAVQAEQSFVRLFQKGEMPENMDEFELKPGASVLDVLLHAGLASSRSEARRLLAQRGVRLDGETLESGEAEFPHPGVLQAGKRRFVRVK
jgi:tyrosyl-tRNA synthetase